MSNHEGKNKNEFSEAKVCPYCASSNLGGLMESFWVPLNGDGEPDGEWNDWSSETELGEKRMCYDCEQEFEI